MNKYFVIFSLILFLAGSSSSYGQCNAKAYEKRNITRFPSGFDYVKTFSFGESTSGLEQTFVFTKGKLYFLNISNYRGEEKNIITELYGPDGKLMATNYDPRTGLFWPIGYACHQSGVHTLKFKFIDTDKKCGIAVLGQR